MRNPQTPGEWQETVNAAKFFLLVHDCQLYGLIIGPTVNVKRCEQILMEGRKNGFLPLKDDRALIEKAFQKPGKIADPK